MYLRRSTARTLQPLALLFCLWSSINTLHAQPTPRVMNVPRLYFTGPDGTVLENSTLDVDPRNLWIVASDRQENTTYREPGGEPFRTMDFLECFYVTEERGNYLHLYKYESGVKDSRQRLRSEAKDYGWADKDRLLLWQLCLEDGRKMSLKALPILTKGTLGGNLQAFVKEGDRLRIFKDPGLTKDHESSIQMFQFLFVYKKVGNSLLVGKGSNTFPYRLDSDLLGWVSGDIVQQWSDRICLEPNHDPEAVEERRSAKVKTSLFIKREQATTWSQNPVQKTGLVWDDDPYQEKWNAFRKRFPILRYEEGNDVVQTGYITDIIDAKSAKATVPLSSAEKVSERSAAVVSSIRNVNIVFVIDGGAEMAEYLSAVTYAMRKVIDRHDEGSMNVMKYGAVVYRDYPGTACPDMQTISRKGLSPNSGELFSFIAAQTGMPDCSTGNKAVNRGLDEALRMLFQGPESKDQSNFVVLIGGAAGKDMNDPRYSDKSIALKMADVKANFCAFQVVVGTTDSHAEFTKRYVDIMRTAGDKSYLSRIASPASTLRDKPRFIRSGTNTFLVDYPASSDLMFMVAYAPYGSVIGSTELSSNMDSLFRFASADIERKINALGTQFSGMGEKGIQLDPSIDRYFISIGEKLDNPELVKKFAGKNYQFFVPGFTSIRARNLTHPIFKRILFVSKEEFDDLKKAVMSVQIESSSVNDVRKKIYGVYLALLATYMGDKKAKAAIESNRMTIEDVFYYVTGLKSNNELLKFRIRDFDNPRVVPYEKVKELQDYLAKKYQGLSQIAVDQSAMLRQDWGTFYWVPEDYLP